MTLARQKIGSRLPFLVASGCALLPFVAVHWAYVLAADAGHVPWCNPYIDSCTSISATGRRPPGSFPFKGIMLPSAMLIAVFWWLQAHWLATVGGRRGKRSWMLALGWLASLGLVLYVTVLGEVGDWWRLQRKIGTILFFSFTFLAQLLFAAALRRLPREVGTASADCGRRMLRVCMLMLCVGVLSVVVEALNGDLHDRVEDAIEWLLALLLQVNFLLCAMLWYRLPWRLAYVKND
ncbi:MAG: hypothetical protein AAF933_04340 [Pseudomonadota bacterium]